MPRKNKTKWERELELRGLFLAIGEGEVTAYQIAKIFDVRPASWLYKMLDKLVDDGVLKVRVVAHRGNANKKLYSPTSRLQPILTNDVYQRAKAAAGYADEG